MNPENHPITPEEVMALRDGELEPADASRVSTHLRECATCQEIAVELQLLSGQLQAWAVPGGPEKLALEHALPGPLPWNVVMSTPGRHKRRLVLRILAAAAVVVMVAWMARQNMLVASREGSSGAISPFSAHVQEKLALRAPTGELHPAPSGDNNFGVLRSYLPPPGPPANRNGSIELSGVLQQGPMVIRTVELAIVAADYSLVRGALDRLLAAQGGFAAQLSATDTKGSAQSLTATLRIPAAKLAATVAELKKLGRVENETHRGDEVTQQYTDLTARLSNARHTEQRLIAVLNQRTGKVKDILEVEQEIARVREGIETLDAQRRTTENQVQLATIQLQVREDFRAALQVTAPTTGTRIWNALAGGVYEASESFLGLVLFLLNSGPTLLLWVLLLFWPVRVAWKRIRPLMNDPNIV